MEREKLKQAIVLDEKISKLGEILEKTERCRGMKFSSIQITCMDEPLRVHREVNFDIKLFQGLALDVLNFLKDKAEEKELMLKKELNDL